MNLYHTTDTDGISELNPTTDKMIQLLSSLDEPNVEEADHPDVSLVHDKSGWAISVFPSGIVTYENLDHEDTVPRYMTGISRNEALQLWLQLSRGDIDALNSHLWMRDQA